MRVPLVLAYYTLFYFALLLCSSHLLTGSLTSLGLLTFLAWTHLLRSRTCLRTRLLYNLRASLYLSCVNAFSREECYAVAHMRVRRGVWIQVRAVFDPRGVGEQDVKPNLSG
jgi:hypothetical protein